MEPGGVVRHLACVLRLLSLSRLEHDYQAFVPIAAGTQRTKSLLLTFEIHSPRDGSWALSTSALTLMLMPIVKSFALVLRQAIRKFSLIERVQI